jgi:catechol 2,3-dioxygenase-like lactoylglutathione lyase family enzyme
MTEPLNEPMTHYHVGIVVADLRDARARLTDLLGTVWGPIMRMDEVEYRDDAGTDLVLPTAICYSASSPSIELIEERPGTVWVRNPHSNLHHIAFWVDGLADASERMATGGCPLQLVGRDADAAPVTFAYHRDESLGVRFELVDASMRDAMAFLFEPDGT